MKKGFFVTFEGIDGTGKSTLIREMARQLRKQGHSVLLSREPGGCPLSEKIRRLIIQNQMSPLTELFLYEASRHEHVRETLIPALKQGKIVLCDRYADSSLAYQASGRGIEWKRVHELNQIATEGLRPDLVVYLDSSPKRSLKKVKVQTRFEGAGVRFQERARRGFLKAKREAQKKRGSRTQWIALEAHSEPPRDMAEKILKHLPKRLRNPNKFLRRKPK